MNLEDDQTTNRSGNRPFEDVLQARLDRRKVMAGGLAAMAVTFAAPTITAAEAIAPAQSSGSVTAAGAVARRRKDLIGFTPLKVAESGGAIPAVAAEYQYQPFIPWGEPILWPYPAHVNGSKTAADQEKQIGIGHDGMAFFPLGNPRRSNRGLIAINHEFGRNSVVLGKDFPESLEDVRLSQAAHGVSVVEARRTGRGVWKVRRGRRNRRVHVNTPVEFSGPVAGHPLLGDSSRPSYGTVNNCSSGVTPWGTYVTCEENFNGYFGSTTGETWEPNEEQDRYGFSWNGFGYGWEYFDGRFDLSNEDYAGEDNRFGWCVEIDPLRPNAAPVKRTALGRFKHEGVAFTTGKQGRVVAYMGDDQRFDYIYKYVSRGGWKALRRAGVHPLDEGTLYVARFNEDGSGDWLPLTIDNPALAERFADQAEVLTYARVAADILGATPMDRPEWTTVAPNGDVFCTLTNNSRREEGNAANPLAPNLDGHIIRWTDSDKNIGTTFEWDIFLFSKDSHGTEDTYSDPDGLWADPDGRLFIQTDGGQTDGGDEVVLNNQMLVANIETGELSRLLSGVPGDEITGLAYTPDRKTFFVNSQHPGNGDPNLTNLPELNEVPDGVTIPRDCTLVVTRKDGGIVGS
jgi:secreted PhoX family phosphatase